MYHPIAAPFADAPDALDPYLRFPGCWFKYDARDLDPTLRAVTGQAATLTRSTGTTVTDSSGTSYTVARGCAPFDWRDTGSGARDTAGLLLASTDVLSFSMGAQEQPFGPVSILVRGIETGGRSTNNAGLLYIGNDAQTGGRVAIQATGSTYLIRFSGGGAERTCTLPFNPSNNAIMDLFAQVFADGGVQIAGRVFSGGIWGSWSAGAKSSTTTLPATWGATTKLRLGKVGSGGTSWSGFLYGATVVRGERTAAELLTRY